VPLAPPLRVLFPEVPTLPPDCVAPVALDAPEVPPMSVLACPPSFDDPHAASSSSGMHLRMD
jgi:hypothetical protein